jgi:hypothetical protein
MLGAGRGRAWTSGAGRAQAHDAARASGGGAGGKERREGPRGQGGPTRHREREEGLGRVAGWALVGPKWATQLGFLFFRFLFFSV